MRASSLRAFAGRGLALAAMLVTRRSRVEAAASSRPQDEGQRLEGAIVRLDVEKRRPGRPGGSEGD